MLVLMHVCSRIDDFQSNLVGGGAWQQLCVAESAMPHVYRICCC